MNKKLTALLSGLALASGIGVASAAGAPGILGSVDSTSYQAMSSVEMGSVQGERRRCCRYRGPSADAAADAGALAIGNRTRTATLTEATAVAGVFSQSYSGSRASARGYVGN